MCLIIRLYISLRLVTSRCWSQQCSNASLLACSVARHETGSGRNSSTCCEASSASGLARCICYRACMDDGKDESDDERDGLSEHVKPKLNACESVCASQRVRVCVKDIRRVMERMWEYLINQAVYTAPDQQCAPVDGRRAVSLRHSDAQDVRVEQPRLLQRPCHITRW